MRILKLSALLTATLSLTAPLAAQESGNPHLREVHEDSPSERRGPFYAALGVGFGGEAIANLGAPSPYTQPRIRPTLNLEIGANIGQQLGLGLEGFAWFNITNDGALETVSALMAGGRVYPLGAAGLYLHGAAGFGRYGQDVVDDYCGCNVTLTSQYGFAWSVGAGYEAPIARGIRLGPSVEMLRMDITGPDGYRERVVNVGLTLTFDGHD